MKLAAGASTPAPMSINPTAGRAGGIEAFRRAQRGGVVVTGLLEAGQLNPKMQPDKRIDIW